MDFRTRRQITILFVAGLIFAGAVFLVAKSYLPAPTCFDGRRNQGEEETDCGGSCLACALKRQKDVEIFWTKFVKSRENTYDVAAEIRNPNARLAARSFSYEFRLFDDTGFLVASKKGISFIHPGETMHLAEIGLITQRNVVKVKLKTGNFDWILSGETQPDIIAGNKEYVIEEEDDLKTSVVRALITNRSINDAVGVEVTVLVSDENGNLVGVNRTRISELRGSDTKAVKFVWPAVLSGRVSTIAVEARSLSGPANR